MYVLWRYPLFQEYFVIDVLECSFQLKISIPYIPAIFIATIIVACDHFAKCRTPVIPVAHILITLSAISSIRYFSKVELFYNNLSFTLIFSLNIIYFHPHNHLVWSNPIFKRNIYIILIYFLVHVGKYWNNVYIIL